MLALPSLELARAQRHKKPLLSCRTTSLQIAAAAIQAATMESSAIHITIDATQATTLPHQTLLSGILQLGRSSKVPVVVEAIVPAGKEAASWWMAEGALVVTLHGTRDAIKRHMSYVVSEAIAHGIEVGAEPLDIQTAQDAEWLAATTGLSFVRLQPREKMSDMHEYVKAIRVPVIAGALHLTPKKSRDLVTAGCQGLTIGVELDEAFTAGIRTALRDRSVIEPARYLSYGGTAVRELVRSHYHYFHP